jgi:phospholipid/cholesterol/gamma-HCH transport system substrate-binding protein
VAGLAPGADVEVGGVHSGTVHSISLPHNPTEKILVVMDLEKATQDIVKKDSVASIQTEGLLGNQYVAISFGSVGQPSAVSGDTIASTPPLQMGELLNKASGILDSSQQAIVNVTAVARHLDSISSKIDSGKGTVGALVNDRQLYANLEQSTAGLNSTILQAQKGVTAFSENMEALKHNFLLSGYFKKRGYENASELDANEIDAVPHDQPLKTFTFSGKQLYDKRDSAKLKHQKTLNDAGKFLSDNEFGLAVIEVSTGKEGDAQQDLTLSQARAMTVREYLVGNFGFDDTVLKTKGLGKQTEADGEGEWGTVKILVFAAGTDLPKESSEEEKPASTLATPRNANP